MERPGDWRRMADAGRNDRRRSDHLREGSEVGRNQRVKEVKQEK